MPMHSIYPGGELLIVHSGRDKGEPTPLQFLFFFLKLTKFDEICTGGPPPKNRISTSATECSHRARTIQFLSLYS
jgi:hypothetical protein